MNTTSICIDFLGAELTITSINPVAALLLLVILNVATFNVNAQQPIISEERETGFALYNQGDSRGATLKLRAAVKRNKNDGDAWYYLGLTLVRIDDMKSARKAFETTVRIKPDFGPAHTGFAYTLMAADKNDEAERHASRASS